MDQAQSTGRLSLWLLIGLTALLAFRIVGVVLSPLDLGPDEAQYWRWGQDFDWGYYSKPPLIAWMIGLTTSLFGDAEWAIRLAPPIAHILGAVALWRLGLEMFDERTGVIAAIVYATMPGIWLSSGIMSTDALLLPLWSLSLLLLWRLRSGAGFVTAILFGLTVTAGFYAKYAMSFFMIGLVLAAVFDGQTKRALLSLKGVVAALTLVAASLPHALWNLSNGFKTVSHTADNAKWGVEPWSIGSALESFGKFYADQLSVFGPITFLLLLGGIILLLSPSPGEADERDRRRLWLLAFVIPPIVVILFQALSSRAHANWAAAAYPAASVLVTAIVLQSARSNRGIWFGIAGFLALGVMLAPNTDLLVRAAIAGVLVLIVLGLGLWSRFRVRRLLGVGIGLNASVGLAFAIFSLAPPTLADSAGLANAFKRLRNWDVTVERLDAAAREINATAIITDEREVWHGLDYYGRDGALSVPVRAWRRHDIPKNFSEEIPLDPPLDENALIASFRPGFRDRIRADFETIEEIGPLEIELGGGKVRRFMLYRASGYNPLERTDAYEERFAR